MQTRFAKRALATNRKFANFRRAKERLPFITITIRHSDGERVSFRVRRSPFAGKLLCMSRCEAASAIGKRIAVVLENIL